MAPRGQQNNLTTTARVRDQASAKFKAIGQSSTQMASGFSASATALNTLDGATGKFGGSIADAGNKIAGVAALLNPATGPFGIALAAATVAFTAVALAMGEADRKAKVLDDAFKSQDSILKDATGRVEQHRKAIVSLREQIEFFGKTMREKEILLLEQGIKRRTQAIDNLGKFAKASKELVTVGEARLKVIQQELILSSALGAKKKNTLQAERQELTERIQLEKRVIKTFEDKIKVNQDGLPVLQEQLLLTEELQAKELAVEARNAAARVAKEAERAVRKEADQEKLQALRDEAVLIKAVAKARALAAALKKTSDDEEADKEKDKQKKADAAQAKAKADTKRFALLAIDAAQAVADGEEGASKKAATSLLNIATAEISMAAAVGAANTFKGFATIPIVGPILGAAAAAAVFTAITAFRSKVLGFQTGGTVTGGISGRDSVPILAQEGETVLDVNTSKQLQKLLNAKGPAGAGGVVPPTKTAGFASGGTVQRGGGGGFGGTLQVSMPVVVPPTRTQARRAALGLADGVKEMQRRGRI